MITDGTPTTPSPTRHRVSNAALWVLQVLLAVVFAFAAFGKLSADPQQVAGFTQMGLGITGMYIIGALELLGAIALLIPRLVGLAALAFVALMTGAVIATVLVMGADPLVFVPFTVGVLCVVLAWGRRRSTADLLALVRGHRTAQPA